MKLCMFSGMFRDADIREAIEQAAGIGFSAVELRCARHLEHDTPMSKVKEIKNVADHNDIKIAGLYASFFGPSEEKDAENKNFDIIRGLIDRAEPLNAGFIIVGCGLINAFLANERDYERSAEWLKRCAGYAGQAGVNTLVEIHNGCLAETAESALKLIGFAGCGNLGVVHDAGNMLITDTDYGLDAVRLLGDKLAHVHLKDLKRKTKKESEHFSVNRTKYGDETFQHTLMNRGAVDHMKVLRALSITGYDRYLSSECNNVKMDPVERARHEFEQITDMINNI